MLCELCGNDELELLDGLCRLCNPNSHKWETENTEQELWEG
jgi:NMD protein affecting ribosome stability and mRNA decay